MSAPLIALLLLAAAPVVAWRFIVVVVMQRKVALVVEIRPLALALAALLGSVPLLLLLGRLRVTWRGHLRMLLGVGTAYRGLGRWVKAALFIGPTTSIVKPFAGTVAAAKS